MDDETRKLFREHAENKLLILLFLAELPPEDEDGVILSLDLPLIEFLINKLKENISLYEKADADNKVFQDTGLEYFAKKHNDYLSIIQKYKALASKLKERYEREKKEVTITLLEFYILCGLVQPTSSKETDKEKEGALFKGVPESILTDTFAGICKKIYGIDRYNESEFRSWLAHKAIDTYGDGGEKLMRRYFGNE
jgi:hypothetical protein